MTAPQVGTILRSCYVLKEQLGKNATRQTWLAEDREQHRNVVVKMLAFNLQLQWQEVKLFEREAQALQRLDHPRIPKYLDYFTLEGKPDWIVLVQSYVPGESLQRQLDLGREFDDERLRQIASDVLNVLTYLHERRPPLLHRDIKPSNLIVGDGNLTYLVDFGAAQMQPTQMGTFTVVGTYGYTPMEQFGGRAVPASDLFALGATLVHLATGIPPADIPQVGGKIEFRPRVRLSEEYCRWLDLLIEPNAEDRQFSAREAFTQLQLISRNEYIDRKPLKFARSLEHSSIRTSNLAKQPPKSKQLVDPSTQDIPSEDKANLTVSRSSFVQPDGSWYELSSKIENSRIKYRETTDELEIQFTSISIEEAAEKDGCLTNILYTGLVSLVSLDILVLLATTFIRFMTRNPSKEVNFWFLVSLSIFILGCLLLGFLIGVIETDYISDISLLVKDRQLVFWQKKGGEWQPLFCEEINHIRDIAFQGMGDPFSDKKLHSISVSLLVNGQPKATHIHLDASLRPSELEWIQQTIINKIQTLS